MFFFPRPSDDHLYIYIYGFIHLVPLNKYGAATFLSMFSYAKPSLLTYLLSPAPLFLTYKLKPELLQARSTVHKTTTSNSTINPTRLPPFIFVLKHLVQ